MSSTWEIVEIPTGSCVPSASRFGPYSELTKHLPEDAERILYEDSKEVWENSKGQYMLEKCGV